MLNEEGLILVAVLVACGLVALGTLELVWPTRPRDLVRRHGAAHDGRRRVPTRWMPAPPPPAQVPLVMPVVETSRAPFPPSLVVESLEPTAPDTQPVASVATPAPPAAVVETEAFPDPAAAAPPPRPPLRIVSSPTTDSADGRRDRQRAPRGRPASRPASRPAPPTKPPMPPVTTPSAETSTPTEATASPREEEGSVVDRCVALLEAERFAEVVTLGEQALEARKSATAPVPAAADAQETARLWGVVGLARRGLDDVEGARFAFEEAIAVGPRPERPTWERHLVALALIVGRRSLGDEKTESSRPERIESLRSAADWLERGLVIAPESKQLRDTLVAVRAALWPTYEMVAKALVQRQEFAEARRIVDEVLADPECPPDRQGTLRALLSSAIGGESGQATAEALRHLQRGRESEAIAALDRAESMISGPGAATLPAERREELERRLWSGYLKLGAMRVKAGAQEAAMSPLIHALSFTKSGDSRHDVARVMLTRALREIVDERLSKIARLIAAGDTGAASTQSEELSALLRGAVAQGLPEADVAGAVDKIRGLVSRPGSERR